VFPAERSDVGEQTCRATSVRPPVSV
jgi:hypothetical protein